MDVRNEMESLVRDEVWRVRNQAAGTDACWCRLCETDVVALALSLLPPFYSRSGAHAWSAGLATAAKIHDAVQAAARRVAHRPKHAANGAGPARNDVGLVNYTYEVGLEMLGAAVAGSRGACSCAQCRADALAYALNRYPPKYGVTSGGRRSLHPTYIDFMRHELGMLVTQAAQVVGARPNHAPVFSSAG